MSVWPVSRIKIPPYKIFISYFLISFISVGLCNEADQDAPAISSYNIHLSRNQLEQAGIESQKLLEKKLNPELVAFALVLNIQKLLELKNQLAIATTRYEEAKTNFGQAQQTLKRLLNLHQNKAISKRKLQIQQTAWRAKKTILESSKLQKQAIIQNVKLNWGNILLNWISDSNDNNLTRIISGEQSLLSLNLPVNKTLALNKNLIFIHPAGDRTKAKQAEFISPAPQSYLSSQGESHFFVTQHGFRAGLHLTAWLPQQKAISGVIIPGYLCWSYKEDGQPNKL